MWSFHSFSPFSVFQPLPSIVWGLTVFTGVAFFYLLFLPFFFLNTFYKAFHECLSNSLFGNPADSITCLITCFFCLLEHLLPYLWGRICLYSLTCSKKKTNPTTQVTTNFFQHYFYCFAYCQITGTEAFSSVYPLYFTQSFFGLLIGISFVA